jgi:hypothetical protein
MKLYRHDGNSIRARLIAVPWYKSSNVEIQPQYWPNPKGNRGVAAASGEGQRPGVLGSGGAKRTVYLTTGAYSWCRFAGPAFPMKTF